MDGKMWGYGAGFARPIPPISSLFQRFPENPYIMFTFVFMVFLDGVGVNQEIPGLSNAPDENPNL